MVISDGLTYRVKISAVGWLVLSQINRVTYRRTDGQTRFRQRSLHLHYMHYRHRAVKIGFANQNNRSQMGFYQVRGQGLYNGGWLGPSSIVGVRDVTRKMFETVCTKCCILVHYLVSTEESKLLLLFQLQTVCWSGRHYRCAPPGYATARGYHHYEATV